MKFRKKPVEVKAQPWWPGDMSVPGVDLGWMHDSRPFVTTIHGGRAYLDPGDWVIMEPDGKHFYPCKPDIFEATYEPVKEI